MLWGQPGSPANAGHATLWSRTPAAALPAHRPTACLAFRKRRDEWRAGTVTGSVLATLEDFLQDFERMVQPSFYRR